MARLVAISYSPWSERARWALDHHHLPYEEVPYTPLLGELWLRAIARKPTGPISVPFYQEGETRLLDSVAIARHADQVGKGSLLFPTGNDADIARWAEVSDEIAAGGRALATARIVADPEAKREALPSLIPEGLRPTLSPLASVGVAFLGSKYGFGRQPDATSRSQLRAGLNLLREGLGHRRFLIGDAFSFADIAVASALQFVLPVADLYISLGPATRRAFTQADVCDEYADLLAWRDGLYADYRK